MIFNSILSDGIQHARSLAGLAGMLEIYLDAVEIRQTSDGGETWDVCVEYLMRDRRELTIDVPSNDMCHATLHFHVNHKGRDTAFGFDDYERLAGASIGPDTARKVRTFFGELGGGEKLSSLAHPAAAG